MRKLGYRQYTNVHVAYLKLDLSLIDALEYLRYVSFLVHWVQNLSID